MAFFYGIGFGILLFTVIGTLVSFTGDRRKERRLEYKPVYLTSKKKIK